MTLRVPVDVNTGSLKDWGRKVANAVNQLANASGGGGGSLADGDYGDIVVSSSGTAINFDSSVVTAFAKTLLDDANAAAARTTLGVTGTGADTAYAFRANNLSDLANASTARTNLGLAIGTDVQAFDSDLGALASNSTNGLWARTGAGTGSARMITAGNGITVTNGDGVSGNPTIAANGWQLHASTTIAAPTSAVAFTGLAGATAIMIICRLVTQASSGLPIVQVSVDNGSTYFTTSGDYVLTTSATGAEANTNGAVAFSTAATAARTGTIIIEGSNVTGCPRLMWNPDDGSGLPRYFVANTADDIDAVRVIGSAGNLTGGTIYCLKR